MDFYSFKTFITAVSAESLTGIAGRFVGYIATELPFGRIVVGEANLPAI